MVVPGGVGHPHRMTSIPHRPLGDLQVSALGFGCWAIGGPFGRPDQAAGWGDVDDDESIAAIRRALELGVTLFDTADVYGTGHSEEILGRALEGEREHVAIATKFGNTFEEGTGRMTGSDASPAYIRRACAASLRRLKTDRIDFYQCHLGDLEPGAYEEIIATLDELRAEGLIRAYGPSSDFLPQIEAWTGAAGFAGVQHHVNVLEHDPEILALCEREGVASLNRAPLAMGLLSGKFTSSSQLPSDDVRGSGVGWLTSFDSDGRPVPERLEALAAIREQLTEGGRTLVQGALAWIWARSDRTLPIPGFKTVAQAEENAGALAFGPLSADAMSAIDEILGRPVHA
jgi:aryl-alcohol dehydrogenase-like predicted oxidoreductase